jgi:hypothetical protein
MPPIDYVQFIINVIIIIIIEVLSGIGHSSVAIYATT